MKTELILEGTAKRPLLLDYHLPSQIAGPTVVYAHGFNGYKDWGGMDLIAAQFTAQGIPFVKFNFSHNGTTPEKPTDFEDLEAYSQNTITIELNDLNIVFKWLETDWPNILGESSKKVLIGHSKGGAESILFAANNPGRIDKLITWSAPAYLDIPWRRWNQEKMAAWQKEGIATIENKRTKQHLPLGRGLFEDYEKNKANYDVVSAAQVVTCPWLICHGTADETVDVQSAKELHAIAIMSDLFMIENTGHTYGRKEPWEKDSLPQAISQLVERSINFCLD
jgi:pimeloyl-ACP methyl ester carboxylesterase